jgi:hypothetical protein
VEGWIDRFADALGERPVQPKETGALLRLSREVAHGVERKLAPLSTFVVGLYAGRRMGEGVSREEALMEAVAAARGLLPTDAAEG